MIGRVEDVAAALETRLRLWARSREPWICGCLPLLGRSLNAPRDRCRTSCEPRGPRLRRMEVGEERYITTRGTRVVREGRYRSRDCEGCSSCCAARLGLSPWSVVIALDCLFGCRLGRAVCSDIVQVNPRLWFALGLLLLFSVCCKRSRCIRDSTASHGPEHVCKETHDTKAVVEYSLQENSLCFHIEYSLIAN